MGEIFNEHLRPRTYFGFGSTSTGTLDMALCENTGTLALQYVPGYSTYNEIASVAQTWQINHWYRFEINWGTSGTIIGRLYDSDGVTLLNTVTATNTNITSGGISFRGFGSTKYFDTVTKGSSTAVPMTPATAYFTNGVWTGNVTVLQAGNGINLHVDDGSGHSGNSNAFNVSNLPPLIASIPANATEGDGTVTGTINITSVLGSDLTVNLASSDTSRVTVPATVTIPAGSTSAPLPLTIVDNTLLDGPEAVTIAVTASGYAPGSGTH